jgi:hypothetical protein
LREFNFGLRIVGPRDRHFFDLILIFMSQIDYFAIKTPPINARGFKDLMSCYDGKAFKTTSKI